MNKKNYIIYVILLPVLLTIFLSFSLAYWRISSEGNLKSQILLLHIDNVIKITKEATRNTARLAWPNCKKSLNLLIKEGALTPYIRSTGIIDNGIVVCSSITGDHHEFSDNIYGRYANDRVKSEIITSVKQTNLRPDHPVIFYATSINKEVIAYSVVDAQYFKDLMDVLQNDNIPSLSLSFGEGISISNNPDIFNKKNGLFLHYESEHSSAKLKIFVPYQAFLYRWLDMLIFILPLLVLTSSLILLIYQRWVKKKLTLGSEIKKGILNDEFSVYYQPLYHSINGKCSGAEALMRWSRGISPDIFIRAAESEGLIIPLTKYLFKKITHDINGWEVDEDFHLGFNVSAEHLMHKDFLKDIEGFINSLPSFVRPVIEITERTLISDFTVAAQQLQKIRSLNCKVAIDDFGTGYCSLSVLQSLNLDYLKVDKTFVDTICTARGDTPVLNAVIDLSSKLGLTTIAEGVSSPEQYIYLKNNGVSLFQGYYFSRPIPFSDFKDWYSNKYKFN